MLMLFYYYYFPYLLKYFFVSFFLLLCSRPLLLLHPTIPPKSSTSFLPTLPSTSTVMPSPYRSFLPYSVVFCSIIFFKCVNWKICESSVEGNTREWAFKGGYQKEDEIKKGEIYIKINLFGCVYSFTLLSIGNIKKKK